MAKGSGDTRVSKWRGANAPLSEDLYFFDGERVNYNALPDDKKKEVREAKKRIINEIAKKLVNKKTVELDAGEDGRIVVHFTHAGIEHFCNDAMIGMSGKYFSEKSMKNIDKILAEAEYFPPARPSRPGEHMKDGRVKWFYYKDKTGRGVYFGVTYNERLRIHEFYTVTENNPQEDHSRSKK